MAEGRRAGGGGGEEPAPAEELHRSRRGGAAPAEGSCAGRGWRRRGAARAGGGSGGELPGPGWRRRGATRAGGGGGAAGAGGACACEMGIDRARACLNARWGFRVPTGFAVRAEQCTAMRVFAVRLRTAKDSFAVTLLLCRAPTHGKDPLPCAYARERSFCTISSFSIVGIFIL